MSCVWGMKAKNADSMLRLLLGFGTTLFSRSPKNRGRRIPSLSKIDSVLGGGRIGCFVIRAVEDAIDSAIEFTKNDSSMKPTLSLSQTRAVSGW